jgi:hypothetical protein
LIPGGFQVLESPHVEATKEPIVWFAVEGTVAREETEHVALELLERFRDVPLRADGISHFKQGRSEFAPARRPSRGQNAAECAEDCIPPGRAEHPAEWK